MHLNSSPDIILISSFDMLYDIARVLDNSNPLFIYNIAIFSHEIDNVGT